MNLFFMNMEVPKSREGILGAMKHSVLDFYRGFDVKPALIQTHDSEHEFFFEGPDALLWGRVFYDPVSLSDLEALRHEAEGLFKNMGEKVMLYVFLPSIRADAIEYLSTHAEFLSGPNTRFFEYYFMQFQKEQGIALREWAIPRAVKPEEKAAPVTEEPLAEPSLAGDRYRFFEQAHLTRDELVELVDLSLELNRPVLV